MTQAATYRPVFPQRPTDRPPDSSAHGAPRIDRAEHGDDGRLPLVIGIAADHGLAAETAQRAETAVAQILAGMRGLYQATPFLLVAQLPARLRGFAGRLAERFEADIVDLEDHLHLVAGPPGGGQATDHRTGAEPGVTFSSAKERGFRGAKGDNAPADATSRAAFLADHCHLVIVVSGSRETAPGGLVEQIIQFRLQGIPDGHTGRPLQLDRVGLGSVHHVVAGENDGTTAADAPMSTLLRPPADDLTGNEEVDDATAWDHLDRFNADIAGQARRRPREPFARRARPRAGPSSYGWVDDRFAVADALAIKFQKATHSTTFGLLVLGLIAAIAFQLSAVLPYSTLVYTASLVLAYSWYLWTYWQRHEHRFHDYRALAEGLRVQMYWSAAGITSCAAEHYLRRQRSEFEWIRQALRAWSLIAGLSAPASLPTDAARRQGLGQVCEQWVDDQASYYSRTALRQESKGRWLGRAGKAFFVVGLLLAGGKPLFPGNMALSVAIGLAPAVAALLYMYAQTRAFLEQARQYDRMGQLFRRAQRRLRQVLEAGDVEAFRCLLLELGKEALRENGDWVLLHRERPITFGSASSLIQAGSWILGVCRRGPRKETARLS